MKRPKSRQKPNLFGAVAELFFRNSRWTSVGLAALLLFGLLTYTNLIRREGFPSVTIPQSILVGESIGSAESLDSSFIQPMQSTIRDFDGVKDVKALSNENFFQVVITYDNPSERVDLEAQIMPRLAELDLPCGEMTCYRFLSIDAAKFLSEYDMVLSVYDGSLQSDEQVKEEQIDELITSAQVLVGQLGLIDSVRQAEIIDQSTTVTGPEGSVDIRNSYAIFADGEGQDLKFHDSVNIGIKGLSGDQLDIFDLRSQVDELLVDVKLTQNHEASVAIDFTDSVSAQITGLQTNVLQAVVAVFLLVAIIISLGAAMITAVFVVLVILMTIVGLFLTGFSINTISLFALVLALGLFVDDSIVISESIQSSASEAKGNDKRNLNSTIRTAVERVATASLMGTLTTVLVFGVLFAIGGIIGDFIFSIPVTVVLALLSSYILSIVAIPHLSRYTILRSNPFDRWGPIQAVHNFFKGEWISKIFSKLLSNTFSTVAYVVVSIVIAMASLVGGGMLSASLGFNIFPSADDSDELLVQINLPRTESIDDSKRVAASINQIVSKEAGDQIVKGSYGAFGDRLPGFELASGYFNLVPYGDRDITAQELIDKIKPQIADLAEANDANFLILPGGPGPGADPYPFKMQVSLSGDNQADVERFLNDVANSLVGNSVDTASGSEIQLTDSVINGIQSVKSLNGTRQLELGIAFESEELSSALESIKTKIQDEYAESYSSYSLVEDDIAFDFGQESDNAESFGTMPVAALTALAIMFILLGLQFKSIVKSALILTAVPFSFLGVVVGQLAFDLPLSFFTMLGFIGLIGVSVNNTIMLTDRMRREQENTDDVRQALVAAVRARFRPLVATTITTLAALVPLILFDPFWKALAVVLAGGLISSTLLVLISFPGFYIIAEMAHKYIEMPVARLATKLFRSVVGSK